MSNKLIAILFILFVVLFLLLFSQNSDHKKHARRKAYNDSIINTLDWSNYRHVDSPHGGKAERRRYYHTHPHY